SVRLRRAGGGASLPRLRVSRGPRRRLLDTADPRRERAVRRLAELPARVGGLDVPRRAEAQRAAAPRGAGAARALDLLRGAALRTGARLADLPERALPAVHPRR